MCTWSFVLQQIHLRLMVGICWPCLQSHLVKTLGSFPHEVHHCPLRILVETLLFTLLSHEDSCAKDGKFLSFFPTKWPANEIIASGMSTYIPCNYFWVGRPPPLVCSLGMWRVERSWWIKWAFGSDQRCNTRTEYLITSRHTSKGESGLVWKKCVEKNVRMKILKFIFVCHLDYGNMMTQH